MTDENQIEDQDVELHDDEQEVMEAMHGNGKKMIFDILSGMI